jgi:hypothetical protein
LSPSSWVGADGDFKVLWEDGDRVLCRGWRQSAGGRDAVLTVRPPAEHPTPASLERLAHAYAMRDELDGAWAVRPLALVREHGRTALVLEDPGGEPLARQLGAPMEVERFLRLAARGSEEIANLYLRNARHCYLRWGAAGKVRQLDEMYPHLEEQERVPGPTGTIGAPVEHLDLATVIKVSQAVSGEMVLDKLIGTLMRTAMAQAGAERALLVLGREGAERIAAEATTSGEAVMVHRALATRGWRPADRVVPAAIASRWPAGGIAR